MTPKTYRRIFFKCSVTSYSRISLSRTSLSRNLPMSNQNLECVFKLISSPYLELSLSISNKYFGLLKVRDREIVLYYQTLPTALKPNLCIKSRLLRIHTSQLVLVLMSFHTSLFYKDSDEFSRVRRERDELQKMLETFEKHLAKVFK